MALPNGILIDSTYVIQSIQYNWSGSPPPGQTFIACNADLLTVGQHAPAWILANDKSSNGVAITSALTPALDATYALDPVSQGQIFQIGSYAHQFSAFPGGSTQAYPDNTGTAHTFTVAQFIEFYAIVATLVSAISMAAQSASAGGSPTWPTQSGALST